MFSAVRYLIRRPLIGVGIAAIGLIGVNTMKEDETVAAPSPWSNAPAAEVAVAVKSKDDSLINAAVADAGDYIKESGRSLLEGRGDDSDGVASPLSN